MKEIVLIGASGFIGSAILNEALVPSFKPFPSLHKEYA